MAIEWVDTQRRLPVYLLLDCSSSMSGVKIQQVNTGVQLLYQELNNDPRSADTIWISVISFGSTAYQMDLVPITQFTPPSLSAGGGRALGSALRLLNQSLDSDLIVNQPGKKGDYMPLILILIDGPATDTWEFEAQKLKTLTTNKAGNIVALVIGRDADVGMLKQITENVLKMENVTGEVLRSFFQWVSQSVQTPSRATLGQAQLASLPQGLKIQLDTEAAASTIRPARDAPIFVSHSHEDDDYCRAYVDELRRLLGDSGAVWYDEHNLSSGELKRVIQRQLHARPVFVVILSGAALHRSRWVADECSWAYDLYRDEPGRTILPVTGGQIGETDFIPDWIYLRGFRRIEAPGLLAYPPIEAARRTLVALTG